MASITKVMTLKEYDIAETLLANYEYISKLDAIKFIKLIFGSTATVKQIITAYNGIDWE